MSVEPAQQWTKQTPLIMGHLHRRHEPCEKGPVAAQNVRCPTSSSLPRLTYGLGKRRKIRCFFRDHDDAACVACQSRGTACVNQGLEDVPTPAETETLRTVKRLEKTIEKLTEALQSQRLTDLRRSSSSQSSQPTVVETHADLAHGTGYGGMNPNPRRRSAVTNVS